MTEHEVDDFRTHVTGAFDGKEPRAVARTLAQRLTEQLRIESVPVEPNIFLSHFKILLVELRVPGEGFLTDCGRLREHVDKYPWFGALPAQIRSSDAAAPVIVVRVLPATATIAQRRRRRFVVMHEFAHWFLRDQIRQKRPSVQFRQNDADEEMLCNLIAADLLLPGNLLAEDVCLPEVLVHRALELTQKYDVALSTLLVKACAAVESFSAFALFDRRWQTTRLCFSTPLRAEGVFREDCIQAGVMRAFCEERPQHDSVHVRVAHKKRHLGVFHVPIEGQRQVLSFVYSEPFLCRSSPQINLGLA